MHGESGIAVNVTGNWKIQNTENEGLDCKTLIPRFMKSNEVPRKVSAVGLTEPSQYTIRFITDRWQVQVHDQNPSDSRL